MKKKIIVFLILLLFLCSIGYTENIVAPNNDFYYLDDAGVLSEILEGEIFFSNRLLYDDCGAQIVVVAIDSTNGTDIEDYSIELFNNWGIGSKEKNNGFLLLLAIQDDDYYACPGLGLKEELSSVVIQEMLNECLEPDFAAGCYDAGVKKVFETVFRRIADIYNSEVTPKDGIDAYNMFLLEHKRNK